MASWKQDFFLELNEKARRANCFIYNPSKVIVSGTIRLEIGEDSLTHTGWVLKEGATWLELYNAEPSKAATEVPENKARFKKLFEHRVEIEKVFGEALDWDYDENRKLQKIASYGKEKATEYNRAEWSMIQDDLIARTIRLGAALKPHLRMLDTRCKR